MDHYGQTKRNANKAADSVRCFVSQVADGKIRTEIRKHLAELDQLISPRYSAA
jgi:hypothetical protein